MNDKEFTYLVINLITEDMLNVTDNVILFVYGEERGRNIIDELAAAVLSGYIHKLPINKKINNKKIHTGDFYYKMLPKGAKVSGINFLGYDPRIKK